MAKEIWKPITNYRDVVNRKYEVSNLGNVRTTHFRDTTNTLKIIKPHEEPNGYYRVNLYSKNHKKNYYFIHRLVAYFFVDNPRNVETVDHIDNNKKNNKANNLQWLTRIENNKKQITYSNTGIKGLNIHKGLYHMQYNNNDYGIHIKAYFKDINTAKKFYKHNEFPMENYDGKEETIYPKGKGTKAKKYYRDAERGITVNVEFDTTEQLDNFMKHNDFIKE